jgi:uncharacterized membrane protein YjjP (DUF1212 family)
MSKQGRSQLILGIILILAGAWFFAEKNIPSLSDFAEQYFQWPFTLMWIGALILFVGLLSGNPGTAVPAVIVAGIGAIFYYNDTYAGGQAAWSYMWTLIPGFVGVGSIVAGLLGDNTRQNLRHGFNSLVFSAVTFLIFSSIFGDLNLLGNYGPAIVLIGLGVWLLARSLWKSFSKKESNNA